MKRTLLSLFFILAAGVFLAACGHSSESLVIPGLPDGINVDIVQDDGLEGAVDQAEETGDNIASLIDPAAPPPADPADDDPADEGDGDDSATDQPPHVKLPPDFSDVYSYGQAVNYDDINHGDKIDAKIEYLDATETADAEEETTEEGSGNEAEIIFFKPDSNRIGSRGFTEVPDYCAIHPALCEPRSF